MILQALNDYYDRKAANPVAAERLPAFGLEEKEIPFILEITNDGQLVQIADTRTMQGKKKIGQRFLVPMGVKKTSGVAANLLWDNAGYVLGIDTKGKPERAAEQKAAFRARIEALPPAARDSAGVRAVLAFLEGIEPARLEREAAWGDVVESNPILTFRLHGETELICQHPDIAAAAAGPANEEVDAGLCLVTGRTGPVERLHAAINGVWGAQTSGANIVSFNLDAFNSYGKSQGANAPVGKRAAFAYTTALKHLLARNSRQRVQVGDASTVFWAEKQDEFEDLFGNLVRDDPDAGAQAMKALFDAVHSGKYATPQGDTRFYVLGLAPNAARIAIRFWHVTTVREMAAAFARHFEDLRVARGPNDPEYLSLFRLLVSVAVQGKADNIPPNLGGDVMRAVLAGLPYPATLLNAAVGRCRAEQRVSYARAAILKAWLNRDIRRANLSSTLRQKEFDAMLDPSNPNPAYRLGRLFAALEKIQEEASPGLNATIRDRYYGAASSTPVTVFTTLLRLKNHHLAKLSMGRTVQMEKLLGEIMAGLEDFPPHLALPEQGRFALGYYHQRHDFFQKHEPQTATAANA